MTTHIERVNHWSSPWAETIVSVAWQSAALVALVAAVCWALRWQSPALRYWLWLIVAAKLLVMPLWRMDVPAPAWISAAAEQPASAAALPEPNGLPARADQANSEPRRTTDVRMALSTTAATTPAMTWPSWLMLAWLAVMLAEVVRVTVQYARLRRLLARSRPADASVRTLVNHCAQTVGLSQPPDVRHMSVDGSPMVCGPWRPVLLLSEELTAAIDRGALRQIVFHELAHLKRRDLWTVWILHAMRTVYWFHPAAHWTAYRAGLDRELACDQLALAHSGVSVAAYAHTLIDAAGRSGQPIALNAAIAAGIDGGMPLHVRTDVTTLKKSRSY